MKSNGITIIVLLALLVSLPFASSAGTEPADDSSLARWAGLCRLWGCVKYFHPALAYKDIDWDAALGFLKKSLNR